MTKKHPKYRPAFTLVEMILAVGIVSVIGLAVTGMVYASYQNWEFTSRRSNVLQDGQAAMEQMIRILRQAKGFSAVTESTDEAGYIIFTSVDDITEEFRLNTVTSELEYGQSGALSALAGPVNRLVFTSYDADENVLTGAVQLSSIQAVNIEATFIDAEDSSISFTLSGRVFIPTDVQTLCLVGWWELDETSGLTAADSSDSGNDGTLNNMVGNEWTTGQVDGALEFDGNRDYIDGIGDCPTGNYTVAGWVKDTGPPGSGSSRSVLYSAGQEIWFGVNRGISPAVWLDAGGNGNGANMAAGTWTRDVWHHIAATWDGSNIHLYLDWVDMPITVYGTPGNAQATAAVIGAYSQIPDSETWYGQIDDVRIYNCALSAEEIELLNGIIYRDFTEAKAASNVTSIIISTPGGTQQNDLLIAAVATDGDTSLSLAPPGGEGWTQIDIAAYSSNVTLGAWWKNAGASESASHQFTWSGSQKAYGWVMRFTGHNLSDPIDDLAGSGESSSTPVSPAVTTTVDNSLILRLGTFDGANITVDNPGLSGHAAITMDNSGGGSPVTYQEFTEAKLSSNGTSITVSTPGGTSEGDLLVAAVVTDAVETISPPGGEGWTQIAQVKNAMTLGIWWKNAGASESPSHQFTWSGIEEAYAWIMRFTGHNSADPINTSSVGAGYSSSPPSPSVTTTVVNTLILRIGGFNDDDITVDSTGLSGHTDITMDESSSGSGTCSGGAGFMQQPAIDASGTSTFSLTGSERYRTVTIAIAPAIGNSVSGGAGYLKQFSSGDSGTNIFLLTGSEESRTLTIAISPAP